VKTRPSDFLRACRDAFRKYGAEADWRGTVELNVAEGKPANRRPDRSGRPATAGRVE